MDFAPVYLFVRFFRGIGIFFVHWYQNGTRYFLNAWRTVIGGIEQSLALKETITHMAQPLYGDYSVIGRIVGPLFRVLRVGIALIVYSLITGAMGVLYITWIAIPGAILFAILNGAI